MDNTTGLYGKYRITKSDGSPVTGFKFVLSPETDPAAREALRTYAFETPNHKLADDIAVWLMSIESEAK
jgi:hypothetical protein